MLNVFIYTSKFFAKYWIIFLFHVTKKYIWRWKKILHHNRRWWWKGKGLFNNSQETFFLSRTILYSFFAAFFMLILLAHSLVASGVFNDSSERRRAFELKADECDIYYIVRRRRGEWIKEIKRERDEEKKGKRRVVWERGSPRTIIWSWPEINRGGSAHPRSNPNSSETFSLFLYIRILLFSGIITKSLNWQYLCENFIIYKISARTLQTHEIFRQ